MNDKFNNIPVEEDTKILMSSHMKWGDLDIVYQKWSWERITAESIIFFSDDVKDLNDEALKANVRDGQIARKDSQMTIKRGEKFTFVNFNFVS